jgi:hypothetical protein
MTDIKSQFQTPPGVADYMASLIPKHSKHILEPTQGEGNLVHAVLVNSDLKRMTIHHPDDFFKLKRKKFDCIIMNPPFSEKHAFGIPKNLDLKGMRLGYYMLTRCMEMSPSVIALMPWFTIIDSDVRMRALTEFGLKSITSLPRKTFNYSRIQTCVIELHKDWPGITAFKTFNY